MNDGKRIGFIATRISDTDGVSLETIKWAEILTAMGFECFYITGQSDRDAAHTYLIEEAHFKHPQILDIDARSLGRELRDAELTDDILRLARHIRQHITKAIDQFKLDFIIAENSLTIPMNIPLGLAIVQTIQMSGIPCIAHHHDFYWERARYHVNAVDDFLRAAFPPPLSQIVHVVINTVAAEEFSRRTGASCRVIPNVMDFENPPPPPDDYAQTFREAIGLDEDDLLVLQPTRVVARKGIEHSVELLRWLEYPRARLVISHASGDEGDIYAERVRRLAEWLGVEVIFANQWIANRRGVSEDGRRLYTIDDVYSQADFITYPSTFEGFGNAFLEAIHHRKPILCNRYSIFRTDIEPYGFRPIIMDGFLTRPVVDQVRKVLDDGQQLQEMVDHNYELGRRFFSYDVVRRQLESIFLSGTRRLPIG